MPICAIILPYPARGIPPSPSKPNIWCSIFHLSSHKKRLHAAPRAFVGHINGLTAKVVSAKFPLAYIHDTYTSTIKRKKYFTCFNLRSPLPCYPCTSDFFHLNPFHVPPPSFLYIEYLHFLSLPTVTPFQILYIYIYKQYIYPPFLPISSIFPSKCSTSTSSTLTYMFSLCM